jgi:hypothetical protein
VTANFCGCCARDTAAHGKGPDRADVLPTSLPRAGRGPHEAHGVRLPAERPAGLHSSERSPPWALCGFLHAIILSRASKHAGVQKQLIPASLCAPTRYSSADIEHCRRTRLACSVWNMSDDANKQLGPPP